MGDRHRRRSDPQQRPPVPATPFRVELDPRLEAGEVRIEGRVIRVADLEGVAVPSCWQRLVGWLTRRRRVP